MHIHIWPFLGPYFLPSSGVRDGRSCVWPKPPEVVHGAAAHRRGCGPFPTPIGFGGLHFGNATVWICLPSEPLQQTLQHPVRVGEVQLQGRLPRRAGLGGDAVQGLSTRWLQVPATHVVLLWDFLMHPGVPVLDVGIRTSQQQSPNPQTLLVWELIFGVMFVMAFISLY